MTKKSMSPNVRRLAAALSAAALLATSAANAQQRRDYEPGLLEFLARGMTASAASTGTDCANCAPNGDYMVNQGPTYSGPAVIKPQPTYSPTPAASGYPYVSGETKGAAVEEPEPIRSRVYPGVTYRRVVKRSPPKRRVANVEIARPAKKGAPQIIRANAEVRIYGPERMDIRLFRAKK